jgi:hypothetical protein
MVLKDSISFADHGNVQFIHGKARLGDYLAPVKRFDGSDEIRKL